MSFDLLFVLTLIRGFSFWMFKDIAKRAIAREIDLENTPVSKVMTMNPTFVHADALAVEALQKMVQGLCFTWRHIYIICYLLPCFLIFEYKADTFHREIQAFTRGSERRSCRFT